MEWVPCAAAELALSFPSSPLALWPSKRRSFEYIRASLHLLFYVYWNQTDYAVAIVRLTRLAAAGATVLFFCWLLFLSHYASLYYSPPYTHYWCYWMTSASVGNECLTNVECIDWCVCVCKCWVLSFALIQCNTMHSSDLNWSEQNFWCYSTLANVCRHKCSLCLAEHARCARVHLVLSRAPRRIEMWKRMSMNAVDFVLLSSLSFHWFCSLSAVCLTVDWCCFVLHFSFSNISSSSSIHQSTRLSFSIFAIMTGIFAQDSALIALHAVCQFVYLSALYYCLYIYCWQHNAQDAHDFLYANVSLCVPLFICPLFALLLPSYHHFLINVTADDWPHCLNFFGYANEPTLFYIISPSVCLFWHFFLFFFFWSLRAALI